MTRRPDSNAVLGLLAIAAALTIGVLVLIGLGAGVPPELYAVLTGIIGGIVGWIGKANTVEPDPEVEVDTFVIPADATGPDNRAAAFNDQMITDYDSGDR